MASADQFELLRAAKGSAWTLVGEWDTQAEELPVKQRRIYDLLLEGGKTTKTLAEEMGMRTDDTSATRHLLLRLKNLGLVEQVANGWGVVRQANANDAMGDIHA